LDAVALRCDSPSMTLARRIETPPSEAPKRLPNTGKEPPVGGSIVRPASSTVTLVVVVSTSLLALFMGGLLWNVYELANISVSLYALYLAIANRTVFANIGRLPLLALKFLTTLGVYASITTVVLSLQSHADVHPVLGHVSELASPQRAIRWLSQWCASLAFAWIVIANCARHPGQVESLVRVLVGSGACVAGVGLVHWFADNGHLFWTIAPQEIFVSNRLRWPFVNCDHMAAFLVMILFPAVAMTHQAWYTIAHDLHKREAVSSQAALSIARRSRSLATRLRRLLHSRHSARNLVQGVSGLLIVIVLSVAVLGTLSRTAWFAMSVGLLTYSVLVVTRRQRGFEVDLIVHRRTKRTSTVRTVRQIASRAVRTSASYIPFFLIAAVPVLFILVLLEGGGGDLIEARLLESSKNLPTDYRWTMYGDSWDLLKSSPLIGIGVGQWQAIHTTAADATLAGVAIEYAHSDVIQTVVELGIIGMVPLVVLASVFVRAIAGIRHEIDPARKRLLAGLATSLVSGLICATFDFPLRLPAVSYLFVCMLSMLAVVLSPKDCTK